MFDMLMDARTLQFEYFNRFYDSSLIKYGGSLVHRPVLLFVALLLIISLKSTEDVFGQIYNSLPDTVFLIADTGTVDSNYVEIWNSGIAGDSVATPFSVRDST